MPDAWDAGWPGWPEWPVLRPREIETHFRSLEKEFQQITIAGGIFSG